MTVITYDWMPVRAANILRRFGLFAAEDVANCSRDELLTLRGMGPLIADKIEESLFIKGFSLKAESEGFLKDFLTRREAAGAPDRKFFVDKYGEDVAKALKGAGIYGKEDFTRFSEAEVCELLGDGAEIIADVKEALAEAGLELRS